ncbi:pilus assembly protein TadG-related protein [Cumulibacter soli]|uniref:pilus assembly protein TadG-related protein n=1 Tax=Cumulibacter soli TaxID=2546344 RepID=UPI0010676401|nr:pilus assembly protein TadG-related protein [Cumulibacter soli]
MIGRRWCQVVRGTRPLSRPRERGDLPGDRGESAGERGSTIPLMLGFFILAGLMLTGGVVASSAFLQLRSLQSACDGAATAAANGFDRGGTHLGANLPFDPDAAQAAVMAYAATTWQGEAAAVSLDVQVNGDQVTVTCEKTAHVPFEVVFAPEGIAQSVTASARAPLAG